MKLKPSTDKVNKNKSNDSMQVYEVHVIFYERVSVSVNKHISNQQWRAVYPTKI
jgi:hypothetical protein